VDAQPGVSGTMGSFIPSSLSGAGIDFVALVSFNNNFVSPALYQWDGSSWVDISSLAGLTFTRQAVGSDYGLEWAFNQGILPSVLDPSWHSISFWGSSVIGGSAQDITDQGITPEPTTLALLGLGLGGLYLRRRRNGS